MALEDIIGTGGSTGGNRIPLHQFVALLHWRVKDPVKVTNAKAKREVESALERTLTPAENAKLLSIIDDIETGKYTVRDFDSAFLLKDTGWASSAEVSALLGW